MEQTDLENIRAFFQNHQVLLEYSTDCCHGISIRRRPGVSHHSLFSVACSDLRGLNRFSNMSELDRLKRFKWIFFSYFLLNILKEFFSNFGLFDLFPFA